MTKYTKEWFAYEDIKHTTERAQYLKQKNDVKRKLAHESMLACSRRRNAAMRRATPPWFERDMVSTVYKSCRMLTKCWGERFEVDHIIPIESDIVCGLHCWHNLQILRYDLNSKKRKIFTSLW